MRVTGTKDEGEIACCDMKKTSTGSLRTLAASLSLLNCPEPGRLGPGLMSGPDLQSQYDLSHRARDCSLLKPWTGCFATGPNEVTKVEKCASRGQQLVQFNEGYDRAAVPDLRGTTRTGKRHTFSDNIHSQILRGSTIPGHQLPPSVPCLKPAQHSALASY